MENSGWVFSGDLNGRHVGRVLADSIDSFLMELQDYIYDKYNEMLTIHLFRTILRFEENEVKAFDKFYGLLEFLNW